MKNFLIFPWLLLFILTGQFCYGQYSISGYLDTPVKNKRVYLSLLRYDEQMAISKDQVLISTLADSTGYFSFTGKLLSNKHKLYRIHANLEEDSQGLDIADTYEIKNFHNFIFSNTDTIVFEKSKNHWFSRAENTNPVDKEWKELSNYKEKLHQEFSGTRNKEAKLQSSSQFLSELKISVRKTATHPLVKLILLSEIHESFLKKDFEKESEFYFELKRELNNYYNNASYALQFEDLFTNLSLSKTQQQLDFYKSMVYLLSFVVLALAACVIFLLIKGKRRKKNSGNEILNFFMTERALHPPKKRK